MIQDIKPFSMEAKRIKNVDNKTKEFSRKKSNFIY